MAHNYIREKAPHLLTAGTLSTTAMRIHLIIIISLFLGTKPLAQEVPGQTEKLVQLAKVWGFLKYYHPNVSKGKFDWDEELFRIIPKLENAKNKNEVSTVYINWLESLGKVRNCRKCEKQITGVFDQNFNLDWISDTSYFNLELTKKLEKIETNRRLGKKHYVDYKRKKLSAAQMINEKKYDQNSWKDSNIRLITLFRYWNFVEYFYPYKYQTDTSWEKVLEYSIPVFLNAKTETGFHLAMLELVASINDSHGEFVTLKTFEYFGSKFLPVTIEYMDDKYVVTGFYDDSLALIDDFRIGDVITKINGTDVSKKYDLIKKYIVGSNESRKKSRSFKYLFNGSTDSVLIQFNREGRLYSKVVHRYNYKDFNLTKRKEPSYGVLSNNTGYINMGWLERDSVNKVFNSLDKTDGLILDFRNGSPNGTWDLVIEYISSEKNDFCRIIYPLLNYPGKFVSKEPFICGTNSPRKYKGKIVLLVNENTQSHGEYSVMSLQTGDNVITIGSRTSGADGNTTTLNLFDNYKTMITGTGVFYPDMSITQRKGVKIDYEITPTIEGVSKNKDELLLKAIELLNK